MEIIFAGIALFIVLCIILSLTIGDKVKKELDKQKNELDDFLDPL